MRVICSSDTHGHLIPDSKLPDGDVFVLAGDITPIKFDRVNSLVDNWFNNTFVPWLGSLKYKHKIIIAGNHDFYLHSRTNEMIQKQLAWTGTHYLRDQLIELEGKTFLGIPWCSNLPRWAFNKDEDVLDEDLQKLKADLGLDSKAIDLLILHAGPKILNFGKSLDCISCDPETGLYGAPEFGNEALAKFVLDVKPRFCISGHLHSAEHNLMTINYGRTKLACVSYLGEDYKPKYDPLVLDI